MPDKPAKPVDAGTWSDRVCKGDTEWTEDGEVPAFYGEHNPGLIAENSMCRKYIIRVLLYCKYFLRTSRGLPFPITAL